MKGKTVTLSLEEKTYKKFREYCRNKGYIVSRMTEVLMEKMMENDE